MASFYSGAWQDPKAYRALLDSVGARFDSHARRGALGALRVPESVDQERLERWTEEGGVIVTTGQQPGLLGGPSLLALQGHFGGSPGGAARGVAGPAGAPSVLGGLGGS